MRGAPGACWSRTDKRRRSGRRPASSAAGRRDGRVPPLGRLALGGRQPRPGHANRRRPESSHQTAFPMAVTRAGSASRENRRRSSRAVHNDRRPRAASSSASRSSSMKPRMRVAHPSFQGIEPIIAEKLSSFGGTRPLALCYPSSWRDLRRRANADSGLLSQGSCEQLVLREKEAQACFLVASER